MYLKYNTFYLSLASFFFYPQSTNTLRIERHFFLPKCQAISFPTREKKMHADKTDVLDLSTIDT